MPVTCNLEYWPTGQAGLHHFIPDRVHIHCNSSVSHLCLSAVTVVLMLATALDSSERLKKMRPTKKPGNSVRQQSFQLNFITSFHVSGTNEKPSLKGCSLNRKWLWGSCKNSLNPKILPSCARLCLASSVWWHTFPIPIVGHPNGPSYVYIPLQ